MKRIATPCLLLLALLPTAARAQSAPAADREARVTLLRAATAARDEGRLQAALELALRAEQVGATAGTRLLVAQLRQQLGDHAGALTSAEQCLREADADTQTRASNRRAIREHCTAVADASRARTGTLRVDVPEGAPAALEVRVNGEPLRAALYGVARAVNAGPAVVTAALPGGPAWQGTVLVAPGGVGSLRVEVPRAEPAPVAPPAPIAPPQAAPQAAPPALGGVAPAAAAPAGPSAAARPGGATQRTLGLVAAGVGVAAAGVGVAAGLMFQGAASDYEAMRCPYVAAGATCGSLYGRFDTLNTLQWVGYVGGGALAAAGLVLFFTAPSAPHRAAFACAPAPSAAGVSCVTTF